MSTDQPILWPDSDPGEYTISEGGQTWRQEGLGLMARRLTWTEKTQQLMNASDDAEARFRRHAHKCVTCSHEDGYSGSALCAIGARLYESWRAKRALI